MNTEPIPGKLYRIHSRWKHGLQVYVGVKEDLSWAEQCQLRRRRFPINQDRVLMFVDKFKLGRQNPKAVVFNVFRFICGTEVIDLVSGHRFDELVEQFTP